MTEQILEFQGLSVLLSFTAENVRSYRDEVHLSLEGTRLAEEGVIRRLSTPGASTPVPVLPAAGIFGANASGKSTILRAMADMRAVVIGSFRQGSAGTRIPRCPFLLGSESRRRASRFEIDLILNGVRWQYGFEIDDERVLGEYAYHFPRGRQAMVFNRKGDSVEFGPSFRSSGRALLGLLRNNSLVLSVAGAAQEERLALLYAWFLLNFWLAESNNRGLRAARTADLIQSPDTKHRVLSMLRAADLGIIGARLASPHPDVTDRIRRAVRILRGIEDDLDGDERAFIEDFVQLAHSGAQGGAEIDPEQESKGTQVWVGLIGPVLDVLDLGTVLLVDELDASLHPRLVERLVQLFQDERSNSHCAQLIFNSHDTTILGRSDRRVLGRDQVWFAEKGIDGNSSLYSLGGFSPRRDDAVEARYLQGRYGAVPFLNPADIIRATASAEA